MAANEQVLLMCGY